MTSPAFNITLVGKGPGENAEHPLCAAVWCGARGTAFHYNPEPVKQSGHVITLFYVDGVQIGQLSTDRSGVPAAITYNGTTSPFTVGTAYRMHLH